MPGERASVLVGHGIFLPTAQCRSIVADLHARAWWQRSEIGEADDRAVDLTACRSLWCSLNSPYRDLAVRRRLSIARAVGGPRVRPSSEDPVVLRYTKGGFFKRHRDLYEHSDNAAGRSVSLVAFLTGRGEPGGFWGGELRLYLCGDAGAQTCVRVPGRTGQFVVFAAEVEHEVLPVGSGERITLVSWLY
jgi:hypothetical protein